MKYPQLKNALFCRILVYVVVIGGIITPVVAVASMSFIPDMIKVFVSIAVLVGALVYFFKNIGLLFGMDTILALLHCRNTARKRFVLPKNFSEQILERRLSRFGKKCEPVSHTPMMKTLRYKYKYPFTVYSSGIEIIISSYAIDYLDRNQYNLIFNSASANSKALIGSKKPHFLDKATKKAPLNRVTIILIYAKQIEEELRMQLYRMVQKQSGDGFDVSVLPCVVDLETRTCTFDSEKIPYLGFQYPVKNRGIKIIRKYVFNHRLPFSDSPDMLEPMKDLNPDQSLWSFWGDMRNELILQDKRLKKRFEKMNHREIVCEDGFLYLKWQNRGVWIEITFDDELRTAEIDEIDSWTYPKANTIAKATKTELMNMILSYCAGLGYTVKINELDGNAKN